MIKWFVLVCLFVSSALFSLEPVIIVIGPPGSGKGTFSQFLKENYVYNHVSAGDVVRNEIRKQTPIGIQIEEIVKRGEYIDTKIMQALVFQVVQEFKFQGKPFIIDGFGRTNQEIEFLYALLEDLDLLSKTFVLFLDASDAICRERMLHRLLCSQCEHIYNTTTLPPIAEGVCDICFGGLKKRMNDTPEIIEKKIREYREIVEHNYKRSLDLFPHIFFNAEQDIEKCHEFYQDLVEKGANFEEEAS